MFQYSEWHILYKTFKFKNAILENAFWAGMHLSEGASEKALLLCITKKWHIKLIVNT